MPLAHGGTVGLVIEIGTAAALGALMIWALWKGRRVSDQDEEGRSERRPSSQARSTDER
jgi:hypothetical protein